MSSNAEIAARVIARARDNADSAAAFDYHIAGTGIGGPLRPLGLRAEIYVIANEHLPEITPGAGEEELARRSANAERLWEQLKPELLEYERRCKARKYTGGYSGGPIRYARTSS